MDGSSQRPEKLGGGGGGLMGRGGGGATKHGNLIMTSNDFRLASCTKKKTVTLTACLLVMSCSSTS